MVEWSGAWGQGGKKKTVFSFGPIEDQECPEVQEMGVMLALGLMGLWSNPLVPSILGFHDRGKTRALPK